MSRAAVLALGVAAVGLAGIVGLELRPVFRDDSAMNKSQPGVATPLPAGNPAGIPTRVPAGVLAGQALPASAARQALVDVILARPLFAPDRRPRAAVAAGPGGAPQALSRVTGIVVDGDHKAVFFAGSGGDKPVVVGEGAELRGYRVQSIEAAQVTVIGPNGPVVLRPAFDPAPPATKASAQGLPGGLTGLSLPNLSGIPGLNAPAGPSAR